MRHFKLFGLKYGVVKKCCITCIYPKQTFAKSPKMDCIYECLFRFFSFSKIRINSYRSSKGLFICWMLLVLT